MEKPWEMTNKVFASKIKVLKDGCERAGIPTTKRQASKWRNKRGMAFRVMNAKGSSI